MLGYKQQKREIIVEIKNKTLIDKYLFLIDDCNASGTFYANKMKNTDIQQIMKIDNRNTASQVRLLYAVIPAVVALSVTLIYLLEVASGMLPVLIGAGVLLLYVTFAVVMHYNYVMIFVGPDKITIRYKALWPVRTDNNYIEINTIDFAGYEITESGCRTNLVVYKNTPGGKAKYPEVCINLIGSEDIEKLKRSFALLETIKKHNN